MGRKEQKGGEVSEACRSRSSGQKIEAKVTDTVDRSGGHALKSLSGLSMSEEEAIGGVTVVESEEQKDNETERAESLFAGLSGDTEGVGQLGGQETKELVTAETTLVIVGDIDVKVMETGGLAAERVEILLFEGHSRATEGVGQLGGKEAKAMVTVGDIAEARIVAESRGPTAERAEEVNISHILAAEGVGKLGGGGNTRAGHRRR
jgi:hypothetical protein